MARRGDDDSELSVLRTEDVPLQEVSGVCLRREAGGDMALVAFGDREVWQLPTLDGKPEGLALTRNGRAMVALDTKLAKENLVLLEPPIAEVAAR
jgi:hypothetical protein